MLVEEHPGKGSQKERYLSWALRDRLDFAKWGKIISGGRNNMHQDLKKKKKNVLCAQERLGSQELKGKEEPDTAGLKSLGKEIELFSGVSQKSLRKAFRKGRKQLVCLC